MSHSVGITATAARLCPVGKLGRPSAAGWWSADPAARSRRGRRRRHDGSGEAPAAGQEGCTGRGQPEAMRGGSAGAGWCECLVAGRGRAWVPPGGVLQGEVAKWFGGGLGQGGTLNPVDGLHGGL